jgi:hypothetical protein
VQDGEGRTVVHATLASVESRIHYCAATSDRGSDALCRLYHDLTSTYMP